MEHFNRHMALEAISSMASMHSELNRVFADWGMDFTSNSGRRNIVLSQAQEEFFAQQLRKKYDRVISDGRTGQPDIVIQHDKNTYEIECKLTTRGSNGSISLQTDYVTLEQKGEIDYLYVVACPQFQNFAVLYFHSLTTDDFRPPSSGSRNKASMCKHKAFHKCTPLVGGYERINDRYIERYESELNSGTLTEAQALKKKKSLAYWKNNPGKYSIELEQIGGSNV